MDAIALPISIIALFLAGVALFGLGSLNTEVRRNRLREIERKAIAESNSPPPEGLIADTSAAASFDDEMFETFCRGRYGIAPKKVRQ